MIYNLSERQNNFIQNGGVEEKRTVFFYVYQFSHNVVSPKLEIRRWRGWSCTELPNTF